MTGRDRADEPAQCGDAEHDAGCDAERPVADVERVEHRSARRGERNGSCSRDESCYGHREAALRRSQGERDRRRVHCGEQDEE